jgi:hypothetical protein
VIPTPAAFLRVGLLLLLALVLELSPVGQVGVLGGHLDLVPLVVAAIAYYGGSTAGTVSGFAMGFLVDLAVVGYGVGRYRELRDPSHGLLPIAVGAAATAGWVTTFAAVSFMLDIGATISPLVIREMIVTVLLNALLAMPVFWACHRVLRPSLAVDPAERRRRRQPPRETGPLGLRGLEV